MKQANLLLIILGLLAMTVFAQRAGAVTYANKSIPVNWVNTSTHAHVGYNTVPYKMNGTIAPGTACGTAPPVLDDTISDDIPFGFNFNYGGTVFTSVRIMSNGRLQFNNNTACGYGSPVTQLPYVYYNNATDNLDYSMRIYGNDLDPTPQANAGYTTACKLTSTCYMSYASIGTAPNRQFIVTWNNIPEWAAGGSTSGNYNLQIILNEDGTFVYQYGTNTAGPQATLAQVGWQVDQADYDIPNVGLPTSNSAILFFIPSPVAQYHFQQSAWTAPGQVLDTSGSTPVYNATALGGAIPGTGYVCNGAVIPNNTNTNMIDAIDTGIPVTSALGGVGTIDFWYKSNQAWRGGGAQDAQLLDATISNNQWFFVVKRKNGRIRFVITDSNGTVRTAQTAANNIAAGTWTHIAVTWNFNALAGGNQDQTRIYINGVQVVQSTFTTSGTVSSSVGTLYLGDNRSAFTGSNGTGRSADGVLDEANIYNFEGGTGLIQRDMNYTASCVTTDHFDINHDTTAINCQVEPVTIEAHLVNHSVDTVYTGTLNLTTSTGKGDWTVITGAGALNNGAANDGAASYAMVTGDLGVTVLGLKDTTVETLNINVSDGSFSELTGTALVSEDQNLAFAQSGFVFLADGVASTIGTQIGGKASSIAPGNQTLELQAIRTSDTTGACEVALQGVNQIELAFECRNPTTCTANQVNIDGGTATNIAGNPLVPPPIGSYTPVNMDFGIATDSTATFVMNYPDVGELRLHARYNIPLDDGSGTPSGIFMLGNSNSFVERPFGFNVVAAGNPAATGPGGAQYTTAGTDFSVTSTAVLYQAGDDANNDGIPDNHNDIDPSNNANLSDNTAALNYGQETPTENLTLSGLLNQPGGGSDPGLLGTIAITSFANGIGSTAAARYDEVGIIEITANVTDANYLGIGLPATANLLGKSGYVGRFYPNNFEANNPVLTNRSDIGLCSDPFTYMGENLQIGYDIEAHNARSPSAITQNYVGAFAKLDPTVLGDINYGGTDSGTNLTARLSVGSAGVFAAGVAPVQATLSLTRNATPDGAYPTFEVGIAPTDSDTVALLPAGLNLSLNGGPNTHALLGQTDVRYGRLNTQNNFGSELLPLTLPLTTEYYLDATAEFVTNVNDSCTTRAIADVLLYNVQEPKTGRAVGNPVIVVNGAATTTLTGVAAFVNGISSLSFTAPGAEGYVDVEIQTPSYLLSDLDGIDHGIEGPGMHCNPALNGTGDPAEISGPPACAADLNLVDDVPLSRGNFGIFKGSDNVIYTREVY